MQRGLPTPKGRAVPAGTPHLRVLHHLRADGERAEPLLERRAQLSACHAAVVLGGRDPGKGSARLPGRLRRKCLERLSPPPEAQCRRLAEVGGAIFALLSLRVPESCRRRQPFKSEFLSHGRKASSFSCFSPNPASASWVQYICSLSRIRAGNQVQFRER